MNPRQCWLRDVITKEQQKCNRLVLCKEELKDCTVYINQLQRTPNNYIMINAKYMKFIDSVLESVESNDVYVYGLVIDTEDVIWCHYDPLIQRIMLALQRINNRIENLNSHIQFIQGKLQTTTSDQDLDALCEQLKNTTIAKV